MLAIKLIHWRLKEVMDTYEIRASDLATKMDVSKNAVSNWRGNEMPRFDGKRLNELLIALNQLRRSGSELIQLNELFQFSLTPEEMKLLGMK